MIGPPVIPWLIALGHFLAFWAGLVWLWAAIRGLPLLTFAEVLGAGLAVVAFWAGAILTRRWWWP